MDNFVTKTSEEIRVSETGMMREAQDNKPRYDLIDGAFLKRWAMLMTRGAQKYSENNWRKATTQADLTRFRAAAIRHLFQYLEGDRTEDHAVAVAFNLAGAEMVEEKLRFINAKPEKSPS
jgi:hypothetical protein